ncbi:TPA: hypothetical protein JAD16_000762 [Proteus mirabilis]|uniref:hypothetical protein n=1 Tax=Proteus mirabilis TaxID=584 RepID=UPI001A25D697|nr:hypothetical protein [Proteus mirabilis]EKV4065255.1 hypothetical protein [Proteus mirabilis]MDM3612091.1 hypothetical protein [Proteus mirabilis]HAT5572777.1 hypothetical protein [Proteus mirabilis]
MTVSTELSHEEYVGNGVTTDFDFRFRIFEGKHLIVVVADSDGNEKKLKNGTDYTIVGAGSYHGGKVVLNKPLAQGWKILLERDLPVVQETDLRNQGKFFAEVHEDAFDYLTMLIQKALGTFSLSLRKPTYLSNYYDAKGNRIANLAPPKMGSDATNKDYVDNSIKDIDSQTLRVKDKPINALPNTEQRANKILAFDSVGQPITVLPESGSASDVLIELGKPTGAFSIGVLPAGNIQQTLYYVTPEQFGAIGDGCLHPLSERYKTLADAQSVYPLATSLSQSIDWAAMQKADNVARYLKCSVRCPALKKYRFSSLDTLMLDINSCFIAGPQSDHFHGTIISKDKPKTNESTNIGDICIVKVKKASDTASTNGFVNGVVFQGFSLEWANVAWMSAVKGDLSICLHMNNAIKAKVDVSVWGGEFGVYGYGCWGMVGTLRVLSCHKGIYFDPVSPTPEHIVPVGGAWSTTSFDLRVEIGGCPFPIYLDKCQYGFFRGYVEVLNSTEGDIWDSANETPIAVQLGSNCECLTFNLGVEFYNGLLFLADQNNKNITANFGFVYSITYMNSSGNHTARYTIANKYSQTSVTIPAATRAIFSFNNTGNDITVNGMNMSASANSFNNLESVDKYLYSALPDNRLFFNGGDVSCTNYLKVSRTNKRVIEFYRNNGLADALKPGTGWYYVGNGFYEQNTWSTAALDTNGVVWVAAPDGYRLHKCEAYSVGGGGLSHGLGLLEVPSSTVMKFILPGGDSTRGIIYKSTVELIN